MSTAAAARLAAYWPTYVQPACSSLLSRDTCNINNNTANRSADRSASEVFYQVNVATGSSFSSRRRQKVYSSQTLRHLRKTRSRTLPNSVVELLRQLSLLHRRGCRGAGSVRRAINVSRAIPVITRPRRHQPRQSAAARTSVLSRPPTARLPTTANSSALQLGLLNVRSLRGKSASVCDIICTERCDVFAVVETWHDDASSPSLLLSCPPNYNLVERARPRAAASNESLATNHGGIAVFFSSSFKCKQLDPLDMYTMELLMIRLCHSGHSLVLAVIYRPGSSTLTDQFFEELELVVDSVLATNCRFVIMGDLNLHVDDASDRHAVRLDDILTTYGLTQHVSGSTHQHGHTLDLVITADDLSIESLQLHDTLSLSDHLCLTFQLLLADYTAASNSVRFMSRTWPAFDAVAFEQELADSELFSVQSDDVDWLFNEYNTRLTKLLDKHAPRREVCCKPRRLAPWFDCDCHAAKKTTRRLEQVYRRTHQPQCRDTWQQALADYRTLLRQKEQQYWNSRISDAAHNPRSLWNSLNVLLHSKNADPHFTANEFATFFHNKVTTIRNSTAGSEHPSVIRPTDCRITAFTPVTVLDISRLLGRCPSKQCALDPVPTWLVKSLPNVFTPILTKIVNASLASSQFPTAHKHALVTPILKKPSLDPAQLNNYRPISNLSFLSKLLERSVASQISSYFSTNDLFPPLQSAYRPRHSTETALLKITNDALTAADRGMVTVVVLLDYSAAFDTVDHAVALEILEKKFGVSSSCLQWFCSYLSGRTFSVSANCQTSDVIDLESSVPQGSTLGPLLYLTYASELQEVADRHGVAFHSFADDTQLSKSVRTEDAHTAKQAVIDCVLDIQRWSDSHRLKLNAAKSEVIWLGTRQQLAKLSQADLTLSVGDSVLQSSTVVKNLGVYIDEHLSMDANARHCAKACFFHLRRIRQLRRYVDYDTLYTLIRALILSRLDYCNSLFVCSSQSTLHRLQRVQDAAARLLCGASARTHAPPLLKQLHWLPVSSRIQFKLCTLMFDINCGTAPQYLSELVRRCDDTRLRSSVRGNFVVLRTQRHVTDKAFSIAGPRAWNALPTDIKLISSRTSFRKKLKTHFFSLI